MSRQTRPTSSDTQILSVKLTYSGTLARDRQAAIPYVLSADFDFTRGTIVAQRVDVTSGKSSVKLQGRVDHALTADILASWITREMSRQAF